mgnify:CR=1 FL=1
MRNRSIKIAGKEISSKRPPYIIAEMSGNHNGDLQNALEIIKIAKESGASAVKLQTYTADTLTVNSNKKDFQIDEGLWKGKSLYQLYEWAHTPWDWHKELFEYADSLDLTIFSSPFDTSAVDFLEDLNTPAYKIASFEAIDIPLIKYVAYTGKPMIISTGMANDIEIEEAIDAARSNGCKELAILHCVSGYPAPSEDYNLNTITDMINRYDALVGLSDHTLNNLTAIASIALGASIFEKHVTISRENGGPDDSFSLEKEELKSLCSDLNSTWESLGKIDYKRKPSEEGNLVFRRSLYFVKDLKRGDMITSDAIRSIRPGYGISPKHFDEIINRKLTMDVDKHTPVTFEVIEDIDR